MRLIKLKNNPILTLIIFTTLLSSPFISLGWYDGIAYAQIPALVSTRGHFDIDTGIQQQGHNTTDYDAIGVPGLSVGTSCPPEIAIYVHGIWVGEDSLEVPSEIFDRARMSLEHNNYSIPLIGFSWDSDTKIDIQGNGWRTAKSIAEDNGPKLAAFISDFKRKCPETEIRIIAHSMGARVLLSSLGELSENPNWTNSGSKIATVNLMGAAVDDEQISMSPLDKDDNRNNMYGNAIELTVSKFYNLFNPEDDTLEFRHLDPLNDCNPFLTNECEPMYYFTYEGDFALGGIGASRIPELHKPANYTEINVRDQIPVIFDADMGNQSGGCDLPSFFGCAVTELGDNHFGYVGFRDREGTVSFEDDELVDGIEDGAMDVVVDTWRSGE
jgi:hypothetical protein